MSEATLIDDAAGGLSLNGDLQVAAATRLYTQLPVTAANYAVNLSAVNAVDSAGIALLVDWQQRLQAAGGALTLIDVPDSVERLARIGGVAKLLGLNIEQAKSTDP